MKPSEVLRRAREDAWGDWASDRFAFTEEIVTQQRLNDMEEAFLAGFDRAIALAEKKEAKE